MNPYLQNTHLKMKNKNWMIQNIQMKINKLLKNKKYKSCLITRSTWPLNLETKPLRNFRASSLITKRNLPILEANLSLRVTRLTLLKLETSEKPSLDNWPLSIKREEMILSPLSKIESQSKNITLPTKLLIL